MLQHHIHFISFKQTSNIPYSISSHQKIMNYQDTSSYAENDSSGSSSSSSSIGYETRSDMSSSSYKESDGGDERTIVLRTMKALENSVYKRPHARYLPEIFRGLWRRQIVEWMYILVKHCKLKHEATAAAVYYLDVAVLCTSSSLVQSPRDYQLCAMTALHLALKVYDSPSIRVVKLSCLVKLGNGEFTEDDIIQKEQDLVRALRWRINPPTADCFLQRYFELLPFLDDDEEGDNEIDVNDKDDNKDNDKDNDQLGPIERRRRKRLIKLEEIASEIIEVALARDRFLSVPPSVIAYAALLSAMELTTDLRQKQNHQEQQHCYYDWSTFLRNMVDIAEMGDIENGGDDDSDDFNNNNNNNNWGNVSRSVLRTKMLLDRIVQGLPLPPEEEDDDFYNATSTRNTTCGGNSSSNESDNDNDNTTFAKSTKSSTVISSTPPSPTSTMPSNTKTTASASAKMKTTTMSCSLL